MKNTPTIGYEAIAQNFIAWSRKSTIGTETVRSWTHTLVPKATIMDFGSGNGMSQWNLFGRAII